MIRSAVAGMNTLRTPSLRDQLERALRVEPAGGREHDRVPAAGPA
jgi:hypothetical protein